MAHLPRWREHTGKEAFLQGAVGEHFWGWGKVQPFWVNVRSWGILDTASFEIFVPGQPTQQNKSKGPVIDVSQPRVSDGVF